MELTVIKLESRFKQDHKELLYDLQEMEQTIIGSITKRYNELLETAIRLSEPPIKGEITKGKVKWRGLKIVYKNTFNNLESWVEQRGVKISPSFIVTFPDLFKEVKN